MLEWEGAGEGPTQGEEKAAFLLALRAKGVRDTAILRAMEMVPREMFAPARFSDLARTDMALPLPCGQTMTAPSVIASVLLRARVEPGHRVLEVGTGSGYLSAVLARLAGEVLSVERYRTLLIAAEERLGALGGRPVRLELADGLAISRAFGRFDRILLNGSVAAVPQGLVEALADDGRLIVPLRTDAHPGARARITTVSRDGEFTAAGEHEQVRIAPLTERLAAAL